jgi:hypothetical protein
LFQKQPTINFQNFTGHKIIREQIVHRFDDRLKPTPLAEACLRSDGINGLSPVG